MVKKEIKKRHMVVPASYLILLDGEKVLLQRRYNTGYCDGEYSLVAGHVDEGESFTEAMQREAKEEVDITLAPENLSVVHIMHRKSADSERVDVFFKASAWSGTLKNCEPHKCDDLSWFPIDSLPDNTIPFVAEVIRSHADSITYTEYGWR